MYFPREGSNATPPHPASSFAFKDYMPVSFLNLRQIFGIDAADYMMSICGAHLPHCRCGPPLAPLCLPCLYVARHEIYGCMNEQTSIGTLKRD